MTTRDSKASDAFSAVRADLSSARVPITWVFAVIAFLIVTGGSTIWTLGAMLGESRTNYAVTAEKVAVLDDRAKALERDLGAVEDDLRITEQSIIGQMQDLREAVLMLRQAVEHLQDAAVVLREELTVLRQIERRGR